MRLAVLGAGGGLGQAFLASAPKHHDIRSFTHAELDIGDHDAVMQAFVPLRPDAVLNFAALTKVDLCETDPDLAYRANAIGPQNLALAARACGAVLLHVSTDYVFDGRKGTPYVELDTAAPISVYGRSKLAGEHFVRQLAPESFVIRTGYVFGGENRDYVSACIEHLSRGEPAGGVADRVGTPTFVRHLAKRLLPVILSGRFGTYHLVGPETASLYDVLCRAKSIGELPGQVVLQRGDDLGLPAPRPRNSALTSLFTKEIGLEPMPDLDSAVREFLGAAGLS